MQALLKQANKSLLKWEGRRRKAPSVTTYVLGAPIAAGLMAHSFHGTSKRSTGEYAHQARWDRNAMAALAMVELAGIGYVKNKHSKAEKAFGHLSEAELEKRIANG